MKPEKQSVTEKKIKKFSTFEDRINFIPTATSFFVLICSATLLLVWLFLPALKEFSALSMKANTSFGLMLASLAIVLLKNNDRSSEKLKFKLAYFFTAIVLAIGVLTGLQYVTGMDIGIDELLVTDFHNVESSLYPGRMSPIACVCFILLSTSIFLKKFKPRKSVDLASLFTLPLLLVSMFAVLGYLYGEAIFYKFGPYLRISWQSAMAFFTLTVGIIFSHPKEGPVQILTSQGFGGITARRLFPFVIAIPISLGWLWLYFRDIDFVNRELGVSLFVVAIVVILLSVVGFTAKRLDSIESAGKKVSEREKIIQKRFMEVLDHAPLFVWALDRDGKFTVSEGKVLKHFGLESSYFIGKDYLQIFNGNKQMIEHVKRAFAGEAFTATAQIDDFEYLSNFVPVKNDSEEIIGISAVSTDITEQKQLRHDLQNKTAFLETIVEQMPTAVAFAEAPSGKILFSNSKFDKVWRRPINHLVNIEQYSEFVGFHSDGRPYEAHEWPLARALNQGEIIVNEDIDVLLDDGQRAVIRVTAAPVRNPDGAVVAGIALSQDVTDMKKVTRALVQSQKELASEYHKFESIFVDSPASMALLRGPHFIFEKVNPKYKALMGNRDLLNKPLLEALPELIGQPFHDLMKDVFETGNSFIANEMMAKLIRHQGGEPEDTYFDFSYSRVDDGEGRPYGVYIHAFEITDKVQAREAIKLQTRAFELALKESPIASVLELLVRLVEEQVIGESMGSIMLLDNEGKKLIRGASPNLPEFYVKEMESSEASALFGFYPDKSIKAERVDVADISKDQRWKNFKTLTSKLDIKSCCSRPIISTRGQVLGTFTLYKKVNGLPTEKENSLIDIAVRSAAIILERHVSEIKLNEIQERLNLALVSGNIGFWDWNAKSGYVFLSDTLMKDWDIDPETYAHTLEETMLRIHADDREETMRLINYSTFEKQPYDVEYRVIKPNGEIIWVNSKGRFNEDANGEPERLTGITINVTERKIAEENLKEALRARDEFLSIASHELKTPLTSLKLQTQLHQRLITKGDPRAFEPERVNHIISLTEKQINRLTRLVDDMLDVARIRSGKLTVERESFDVCAMVEEVVERMKHQFLQANYPLPTIVKCEHLNGDWDRFRMEQVVSNLLTNAIRYGNKNPIQIVCEKFDEKVRIKVRDGGIGIKENLREKIFDRFERAVNSNEISGLGLGLFITKQIIVAHGGKIWVESELGVGSEFIVEVPIKVPIEVLNERNYDFINERPI